MLLLLNLQVLSYCLNNIIRSLGIDDVDEEGDDAMETISWETKEDLEAHLLACVRLNELDTWVEELNVMWKPELEHMSKKM